MFYRMLSHVTFAAVAGFVAVAGANTAAAQKNYDPGATDTEIKIGNIMPYSGPLSAFAAVGKTEAAYFKKLNSEGGINGRKINFISYDDGYSPPKTVEQSRRLVESDEVLLIFNSLGRPTNAAIHKYMNSKKCRSFFSRVVQPSGTIRKTFPGAWAGSPASKLKPGYMPPTS